MPASMIDDVALDAEPATAAKLSCFKRLEIPEGARVALVVAHAPAGRVKPNVPIYCAALRRAGLRVVLIAASDDPFVADPALTEILSGGYVRENKGYDFAAWAHLLKTEPKLWSAEILFLLNDSVIGPLSQSRLDDLIERINSNAADVVGATENFDFEWHLQSYFMAFKRRALASAAFRGFFDEVRNLPSKDAVIQTYEIRLSRVLSEGGLSCAPAYRSLSKVNQTLGHWRDLIDAGFPFVKTELVRGLNPDWNIIGWRETLAVAGFDPAVAAATVAAGDATAAYGSSAPQASLNAAPRKAILVLGMHRSGTSAVAGVISGLGAASPKTPLVPQDDNPRGFFESATLVAAHNDLLASAASRWDDWRQFDPLWFRTRESEEHRQKIRMLLVEEFGGEPLICIKDPRICRFVPFVCAILAEMNYSPVAVLPVRNPLEVALSLQRRDNIALSTSVLLWLRHVLDAEFYSRHMPRCFLSYEDLLTDWRRQMERVAETTGIGWPDRSDLSASQIDDFLSADLRHERFPFDAATDHPAVVPLARDAYDALTDIVSHGESKEMLDRLDRLRAEFDEACRTFAPALAEAVEAQRDLASERDSLRSGRDDLAVARDGLRASQDVLADELDRLKAERDSYVAECGRLIAARDALLASTSWRLTAPLRMVRAALAGPGTSFIERLTVARKKFRQSVDRRGR
jgi:hypothetical protein